MFRYPCKDCSDRVVGCHSKCDKYLATRAEHKRWLEECEARIAAEKDIIDFKLKTIYKTNKKYDR